MTVPIRLGPMRRDSYVEVSRMAVASDRLPAELDGFRIAVLADLHYGPMVGAGFVRRIVAQTARLAPDAVVLCGDTVERSSSGTGPLAGMIAELAGSVPTYAVLGNHDYYGCVGRYCRRIRAAGVELLVNAHRLIGPAGGAKIALAGLDDLDDGAPDVAAALDGIPPGTFTVLAAHNPDLADSPGLNGAVDLMVAGHTHGGQIRLFGWAPITFTRNPAYKRGMTRAAGFPLYISRGLGVTGMPIRVDADPELPIITLRRSQ